MAIGMQGLISLGTSGLGMATGLLQRLQANRLERNNPRPTATVSAPILQNQAMASLMANQGMNQSQYNNAVNQQAIGLSSGLRSQGLYGRGAFNANTTLRNFGNQVNQLNIADDQARQQNQRALMSANQSLAQEQLRVWNWNKAQPYQQMAQRIASLKQSGNQNIVGGIGQIAQAGLMGAFGGENLTNPNGSTNTEQPFVAKNTWGSPKMF